MQQVITTYTNHSSLLSNSCLPGLLERGNPPVWHSDRSRVSNVGRSNERQVCYQSDNPF